MNDKNNKKRGHVDPYVAAAEKLEQPDESIQARRGWGEEERDIQISARANAIGDLVADKQHQYGDAVSRSEIILRALYPAGVRLDQLGDMLLLTRITDKMSRIAQRGPNGKDLGGESPFRDIAGYGILGSLKDEP